MLTIDLPKLNLQDIQYSFDNVYRNKDHLMTYSQFKEKVFEEFEMKELNFRLQYEPMTPFANEDKEIQYIKELKTVGQEIEWGSNLVDLGVDSNSIEDNKELESNSGNYFSDIGPIDSVKINHGDNDNNDSLHSLTSQTETLYQQEKQLEETSKQFVKNTMSRLSNELVTKTKEIATSEDNGRYESIDFEEGMALREFLRRNPTVTAEVVYKYYSKQEVKKALILGKIVKRGNKLFI